MLSLVSPKLNPDHCLDWNERCLPDKISQKYAVWVIGCRNFEKALLWALLQPDDELKAMQDAFFESKFFADKYALREKKRLHIAF